MVRFAVCLPGMPGRRDYLNYQKVYAYLNEHGIKRGTNGYDYLAASILYVSDHPNALMNEVCEHAATQFGVDSNRVDGCMRYSLRSSSMNGVDGRPREFIRTAARFIQSGGGGL